MSPQIIVPHKPMRRIIDDEVLQHVKSSEIFTELLKLIPGARESGLTLEWAFGNACLIAWRRLSPDNDSIRDPECYLNWHEVLSREEIIYVVDEWRKHAKAKTN